jgi:hypothetical protein
MKSNSGPGAKKTSSRYPIANSVFLQSETVAAPFADGAATYLPGPRGISPRRISPRRISSRLFSKHKLCFAVSRVIGLGLFLLVIFLCGEHENTAENKQTAHYLKYTQRFFHEENGDEQYADNL